MRDAREQLVEIEDRAHLAADLGQRLERLGVLALRLEQPRVDDAPARRARANCRSIASSRSVNASLSSDSRLSAPSTLPLCRSGTARPDCMFWTTPI